MSDHKEKKQKHDFRVLSSVRCTCGCGKRIKQNVLDRNPHVKQCYLSYLLSKGKTHVFTGTVEMKGSSERRKIYAAIAPKLEKLRIRAKNRQQHNSHKDHK